MLVHYQLLRWYILATAGKRKSPNIQTTSQFSVFLFVRNRPKALAKFSMHMHVLTAVVDVQQMVFMHALDGTV